MGLLNAKTMLKMQNLRKEEFVVRTQTRDTVNVSTHTPQHKQKERMVK